MNNMLKIITGVSFLIGGAAFAAPITGTGLQDKLDAAAVDGANDVNVVEDQIPDDFDSYWRHTATGAASSTLMFELASFTGESSFGLFDSDNHDSKIEIFGGDNEAGNSSAIVINDVGEVTVWNQQLGTTETQNFGQNAYGFYLQTNGSTFYSDSKLNANELDHMLAFRGVGEQLQVTGKPKGTWTSEEYILAWETLSGNDPMGGYDDVVIMVESLEPIPEPGTIGMIGLGLVGLALALRRRKS